MPARDAGKLLYEQANALRSSRFPVVVVQNGHDPLEAVAAPLGIEVVRALERIGVSYARNAGVAATSATIVVFCDADDIAAPGFVDAMTEALGRYDVVGGALDRRRFLRPEQLPEDAGPQTELAVPFAGYLPFASGAAIGVRREVFDTIGGFDETYVRGGDDVDFCWRAQQAGFTIGFAADAVMHYRERATLRGLAKQHYRFGLQDPHLFRDHRSHGMPRPGPRAVVGSWLSLTVGAPRWLTSPYRRRQWVRSLARRVGRVVGSVRWRTLYL